MGYQVKLEQFEGPLDLLLQLIEKEKLPIIDISLAKVSEEYLCYIHDNCEINPEELVDFLVIATKLLLIKSKLLLPTLDEDDTEIDLSSQLKIYKVFLDASLNIEDLIEKKRFSFIREKSSIKTLPSFSPPKNISGGDLRVIFSRLLKGLKKLFILPESVMQKSITLKDKIFQIKNILNKMDEVPFDSLMSTSNSKIEVIVGFLALLELIKGKEIQVAQCDSFGKIMIKKFK